MSTLDEEIRAAVAAKKTKKEAEARAKQEAQAKLEREMRAEAEALLPPEIWEMDVISFRADVAYPRWELVVRRPGYTFELMSNQHNHFFMRIQRPNLSGTQVQDPTPEKVRAEIIAHLAWYEDEYASEIAFALASKWEMTGNE